MHIMIRPYRIADLRADEGIGPYDRQRRLHTTVGVDPQIDPQRHVNGNVNIEAKSPTTP